MESAIHEFKVEMTCEGCSGAVEKVLSKLKGSGIDDININLPEQTVTVKSSLSANELLNVIQKTGKKATYIGPKSS